MRSGSREGENREENSRDAEGGGDAEPGLVMLQLCHQPVPELPHVMKAMCDGGIAGE